MNEIISFCVFFFFLSFFCVTFVENYAFCTLNFVDFAKHFYFPIHPQVQQMAVVCFCHNWCPPICKREGEEPAAHSNQETLIVLYHPGRIHFVSFDWIELTHLPVKMSKRHRLDLGDDYSTSKKRSDGWVQLYCPPLRACRPGANTLLANASNLANRSWMWNENTDNGTATLTS